MNIFSNIPTYIFHPYIYLQGSSDSGKGGSDVATPPSRTPAGDGPMADDVHLPSLYEFVIPQTLVGRLIGKHGSFVAEVKEKTHAHIIIKKHPSSNKSKVCSIEGKLEIVCHRFISGKLMKILLKLCF